MLDSLPVSQRRNIAVALLAVITIGLLAAIVTPLWAINADYQERIEQQQQRLLKLESIAALGGSLRARHHELMRNRSRSGHTLNSETEALAAADLQRIVKALAGGNGTQLVSTQILPATEANGLRKVALRVRMSGPLTGIVESIYELEADSVFLFLENLTLQQVASRRLRLQAASQQFEAGFDLIAYMTEVH